MRLFLLFFVLSHLSLLPASESPGELRFDFQVPGDAIPGRISADPDIDVQLHPDGRAEAGALVATHTQTQTRYLSLRCDDLCEEGEGLLLSMWVKGTHSTGKDIRAGLSLRCPGPDKKNSYVSLASVPLLADRWTLLSGWHFRKPGSPPPQDFKISIEPGVSLHIDNIVLTRSSIAQPPDTRPLIQVRGSDVMNGDQRFLLHGINLFACSDDESSDTLHETGTVTEEDYASIRAAGFTCVRLNLWHKVFRESGGWEWLKLHALWARRNDLRLILDMHSPPGGYQSNSYRGPFWKNPSMQQELIDFWVRAAREYADDPVVAAFDLLNEPKPPRDADWLAYASRTLKELRKAGWNRPVIIESSMLADGWTVDTRPFEDADVIYDTHFYTPWSFTYSAKSKMGMPCVDYGRRVLDEAFLREHLQADLLAFAAKNKVPVNMGEFGVSDKALAAGGEKWLSIVLSILDEHQVHRQYFCWCVYGDFAIEPGWFRRSPSLRRENVLTLLKAHSPTLRKEP